MKYPESPRETPCSRKCGCWNNFGVCGRSWSCDHHAADYEAAVSRRDQPAIRYASVEVSNA